MHPDLASIRTNILYMIIILFYPAPSTSFPFTFRPQITSSHSHLFPFGLLLLVLFLLKQCSHFSVNSVCAYLPLNPPPSFCTAFLQFPEKTSTRSAHMFIGPINFLFSPVCESYIPIWYYIYDAWHALQFSISTAAHCE